MGSSTRSKTSAGSKAKPKARKTAGLSKTKRLSKSSKTKKSSRLSKTRRSKTVRSKTTSKSTCPHVPGKTLSTPKRKSKSRRSISRPTPKKVVSLAEAKKIGHKLGINFKAVSPEEYRYGMNIEIEHGKQNKLTNVTNNDLLITGKIALAHILEYPDYYVRLKKMETDAEKYWSKKRKPNMLIC